MPPNYAWEVLDRRKERDLVVQRDDFVVVRAYSIAISFNLLRPCNHDSKIGCLGQFGQFSSFRRRKSPRPEPGGLKMRCGLVSGGSIQRSDELRIVVHFLLHMLVLAAHRTMNHIGTRK